MFIFFLVLKLIKILGHDVSSFRLFFWPLFVCFLVFNEVCYYSGNYLDTYMLAGSIIQADELQIICLHLKETELHAKTLPLIQGLGWMNEGNIVFSPGKPLI